MSATVGYFTRREDFIARLDAEADRIEKRFRLTRRKMAEALGTDERGVGELCDYYGVDWREWKAGRTAAKGRPRPK